MQFSFPLTDTIFITIMLATYFIQGDQNMAKLWLVVLDRKHVKVRHLSRVKQISFVAISFKNVGQTLNKAILCHITCSSSHHHVQYLRERGGRETHFKGETCSEIYLREGPHSLIDANTFPGRHTTCSGCQSHLTRGIDAYYTFTDITENTVFYS